MRLKFNQLTSFMLDACVYAFDGFVCLCKTRRRNVCAVANQPTAAGEKRFEDSNRRTYTIRTGLIFPMRSSGSVSAALLNSFRRKA